MNTEMLNKYAELVVRTGINLQDKQQLLIISSIECASFARMIAEKAYEAGAINVIVDYKDGKIVNFTAEMGGEILKGLLDTDEGARYLGEVALVSHNSPISNLGLVFFNGLFDENASCHFAFGEAYPSCLTGSENMSKEELLKKGVNDSLIHVDFMIGSAELEIIGETAIGEKVQVFKNGDWVI